MMEVGILEPYPLDSFESSVNITVRRKWPVKHVDFIDQMEISRGPIYSQSNLQVAVKFDEQEKFILETDISKAAETSQTPESAPCTVVMLDTGKTVDPMEITNSAPKLLIQESDGFSTLKMTADVLEITMHPELPSQLHIKDDQTITDTVPKMTDRASATEVIGNASDLQSEQSDSESITELTEMCSAKVAIKPQTPFNVTHVHEEHMSVLLFKDHLAINSNACGDSLMCLEDKHLPFLCTSCALNKIHSAYLDTPEDTVKQENKVVFKESVDSAQKLKGSCLQNSVPKEICLSIAPAHLEMEITSSENRDPDCHKLLTCANKSEDHLDNVLSPDFITTVPLPRICVDPSCPEAASNLVSLDCNDRSAVVLKMETHCTSTLYNQSCNVDNKSGTLNACCTTQPSRPPDLDHIDNLRCLKIENSSRISDIESNVLDTNNCNNDATKLDQALFSNNIQPNWSLKRKETNFISDCLKAPCQTEGHVSLEALPQCALVPYVDILGFLAKSKVPAMLSVHDNAEIMSNKMKESILLKEEPWTVLKGESVQVSGDKPIEFRPLLTSQNPTSLDRGGDRFMECCANDKEYKLEVHSSIQQDNIISPLIHDPNVKCDVPACPFLGVPAGCHNVEVPNVETPCGDLLNDSECIYLMHDVSGPIEPILEETKKPFSHLKHKDFGSRFNTGFEKPSSTTVMCNRSSTSADTGLTLRLQEAFSNEIQPLNLFMEDSLKYEKKTHCIIGRKRGLVELKKNISNSKTKIHDQSMSLIDQQCLSALTKGISRESASLTCSPTQQAKRPKICNGRNVQYASSDLLGGINCLSRKSQSCLTSSLRPSRKKAEPLIDKQHRSQVSLRVPVKKLPSRKCKGLSVQESLNVNQKTRVIQISEPFNSSTSPAVDACRRILPSQNVVSNWTSKPVYATKSCMVNTYMKPTVLQKCTQDLMLLRKLSTIANRLSVPCESAFKSKSLPSNLKVIPYGGMQFQARKLFKVFTCVNMKINCQSGHLWQESVCLTSSRDHLLSQYNDLYPASLATACFHNLSDTFSLWGRDSSTFPVSFEINVNPSCLTDLIRFSPPDYKFNSLLPSTQSSQISEWTLSLLLSSHMPIAFENVHLLTQWNPHFKALDSPRSNSTYRSKSKSGCSMLGLHTVLALSSPGCYRLWTRKRNLGSRIPTIQKLSVTQFAHGLTRLPQQLSVNKEMLSSFPFALGRILSSWSRHGLSAFSSACSTPDPHCSLWLPEHSQNTDISAEGKNLHFPSPLKLYRQVNLKLPFDFHNLQDNQRSSRCFSTLHDDPGSSFPSAIQDHAIDHPDGLYSQQGDGLESPCATASAQTCSLQQQESTAFPCAEVQNSNRENEKEELKRKTRRVSQIKIRRTVPKPDPNLTPMGLPKPKRLNKKQFSLEDIYTNKNYKPPPPTRHLETIFEEPIEKNGVILSVSQQKKKRIVEFRDYTVPRFNRARGKVKVVTCCKRGRKAALQGEQIEALLSQKLKELENCLLEE